MKKHTLVATSGKLSCSGVRMARERQQDGWVKDSGKKVKSGSATGTHTVLMENADNHR